MRDQVHDRTAVELLRGARAHGQNDCAAKIRFADVTASTATNGPALRREPDASEWRLSKSVLGTANYQRSRVLCYGSFRPVQQPCQQQPAAYDGGNSGIAFPRPSASHIDSLCVGAQRKRPMDGLENYVTKEPQSAEKQKLTPEEKAERKAKREKRDKREAAMSPEERETVAAKRAEKREARKAG